MNFDCCPLCQGTLSKHDNKTFITYLCDGCAYDGMPKFIYNYDVDEKELISSVWWLDDYYIQTDYVAKTTRISKIEVCMLLDAFLWPSGILEVDPKDPFKTARRLDVLVMFS